MAQGHFAEALHQLALAEERVRRFANPAFMATIAAHRASIWRAQGNQAFLAWLNDGHPPAEDPLTAVRDKEYVTLVRGLIDAGFGRQLLLSHDICSKHRLARYGGHGYDHLVANVMPWMRQRGFAEDEIAVLLVRNPAEMLAGRSAGEG